MSLAIQGVPDLLRRRAADAGDAICHISPEGSLTFREWDDRADAVASGLMAAGVQPGDRVLLPITNACTSTLAASYIAVHRAGGINVPINTRWTTSEVAWFSDFVGARWAITDRSDLLAGGTQLEQVWTVEDLPRDPTVLPDPVRYSATADADILATSGTTGRPKGVVCTHAELLSGLGDGTATSPVRRIQHALPLTGYGGCHGLLLLPLAYGTTVVTSPRFDPDEFFRLIVTHRPDALQVMPAMLRLLLDSPGAADRDLSSVRFMLYGGAPLPTDTLERASATWPDIRMVHMYSATEAGLSVRLQRSRTAAGKPGSVGKPSPGTSLEIRDPDNRVVPTGEEGELWIKPAGPTRRYWNDPEATEATWPGGWLRTGDLGFLDADGDLHISGRLKEIIIRGGYNISPVEIEDVLHAHPAVAEAAVTAIPHDVLGEDMVAVVVPRPGSSLDLDNVRSWMEDRLASYKVPRRIVVTDSLPRNAMGKVVKSQLQPLLALEPEPTTVASER